jgi:hypothetical protein
VQREVGPIPGSEAKLVFAKQPSSVELSFRLPHIRSTSHVLRGQGGN